MNMGANRHRKARQRKPTDEYNHNTSWREPTRARRRRKPSDVTHLASMDGRPRFDKGRLHLPLAPLTRCGKKLAILKDAVVMSATATTCAGCLMAAGAEVK
jgi:hypothetical protein